MSWCWLALEIVEPFGLGVGAAVVGDGGTVVVWFGGRFVVTEVGELLCRGCGGEGKWVFAYTGEPDPEYVTVTFYVAGHLVGVVWFVSILNLTAFGKVGEEMVCDVVVFVDVGNGVDDDEVGEASG